MIHNLCNPNPAVTLNLFQGPSTRSNSGRAARWMLKQVQHDEVVLGAE
jgi:hypothetical protein